MYISNMPHMKHSGDRLNSQLKKIGMTQAEFGRRTGASSQNITNWLKRGVPAKHHLMVSKIIDVNYEWLLNGNNEIATIESNIMPTDVSLGRMPDISQLMMASTPRTKKALEEINQAAISGKLSEDDVELLNAIARKLSND